MIAVTLVTAVTLVAAVVTMTFVTGGSFVTVLDTVRVLGAGLRRRPRHEEVQSGCRSVYAVS